MEQALQIYNRADIVNFMNTGTSENPVYTRMQGFTSGGKELNPSTYTRRYIDEENERETTTGYSPNIPYAFDRIVGNAVHEKIAEIHDDEIIGASVDILTVNTKTGEGRLRNYDVNPDTEGDGTDAYTYNGNFHANGTQKKGTATVSADGLTATFTPSND